MKRRTFGIIPFLAAILCCTFIFSPVHAREEYALQTGKSCIFCHQESTGGQLKTMGFAYIRNGYRYPIPERILRKSESLQSPAHKFIRFVIGYIHLLAAVIFFGAIFYIHIFVGPKKLQGGIPRDERILGVTCMAALTLTGIYLTWMRIDRGEQFFNNTFGLMLFAKILLFLLMVAIAITAITTVHRRMKREASTRKVSDGKGKAPLFNPLILHDYDGTQGKPAYVKYGERVYDVSESRKWKGGRHFGKHAAGSDLTGALTGAPHGPEVLERFTVVGEMHGERPPSQGTFPAHAVFVKLAYTNLVIIFLILACISVWRWDFPLRLVPEQRVEAIAGEGCISCHEAKTPGIYHDWSGSVHAKAGVSCYDCHRADPQKSLHSGQHLKRFPTPVAIVVTPRTCSGCHPSEAEQYAKCKHAHTLEIIWKIDLWLNSAMNNATERTTGCYACHGTVVEIKDGGPIPGTWPNVGVGRKNPDGTLGSCTSCHTRHRFSLKEARKPEACDQCHLGPDHPQIEIYNESKHGAIYHAEGDGWNWATDDGKWLAGRDFRAPTCSACHMSAADDVPKTHDVTQRLSWETQAPLTIRPADFKPFPASTDWREEREKMEKVCLQCHSRGWTRDHFANLDAVVKNYNETYYEPIQKVMDGLYESGLLSRQVYFDESIEWEFYELWHHEGRRARFGAAMMAPDYAWWHGFYEVKHRFNRIIKEAAELKEKGAGYVYTQFPGKFQTPSMP